MVLGEIGTELAKLRAADLVREGCRLRRLRSDELQAAASGRVGCLPPEGQE